MHYIILLWPHANVRYQAETVRLARAELELMLARLCPEATVGESAGLDLPALAFSTPAPLSAPALSALSRHSLLYGLFEARADGALFPVCGRAGAYLGSDLAGILKYKGKTNEIFLQLLINVSLYAGSFWDHGEEPLEFYDPLCGRATALFEAVNRGWNATGTDLDRAGLGEAERFFKRYLEYHRFKHAVTRESRTLDKGRAAPLCRFEYAPDARAFREGGARTLSLVNLDATLAAEALGKDAFHIVACDLPYGVRHDAQLSRGADRRGNWLETLLAKALPDWRAALKPGGTVAVSFNAQNFSLVRVRDLMVRSGFEVMQGGAYDEFAHWVEQAITRDIAVCRKPA